MDLEQIGYFLYMEEQEQLKVNVENTSDFVGEQTTTDEDDDEE